MKSPSTKRSRASSSGARFSKAPDKFTYFLRRQSQTAFFVILLFGDLVLAMARRQTIRAIALFKSP